MSHKTGQRKLHAWCEACGKDWWGMNAMGVGAVHSRKYKHEVVVEILQYIIYPGEKSEISMVEASASKKKKKKKSFRVEKHGRVR